MKKSPRQDKPSESEVSQSLHARLNMYGLAASAAGVGVLALTQPAQAKVVFTPVHQVIGANGVYNLDLNGDGTVDFLIQEWNNGAFPSSNALLCDAAVGNGVLGSRHRAAALSAGASIGPNLHFTAGGNNGEAMITVTHFTTGGTSYVHGYWVNVLNRYLGLKFQIAGKTHYGWARVTVSRKAFHFTAVVTGYAYETTPNLAIIAGQIADEAADSSRNPANADSIVATASVSGCAENRRYASLGELALGVQHPFRRQP
jgi:hypothetical protein